MKHELIYSSKERYDLHFNFSPRLQLTLRELSAVPFVSGNFFCNINVNEGAKFHGKTKESQVQPLFHVCESSIFWFVFFFRHLLKILIASKQLYPAMLVRPLVCPSKHFDLWHHCRCPMSIWYMAFLTDFPRPPCSSPVALT